MVPSTEETSFLITFYVLNFFIRAHSYTVDNVVICWYTKLENNYFILIAAAVFFWSSRVSEFQMEGLVRLSIIFSFLAFSFGFEAKHSKYIRIDTPRKISDK